MFIQSVLSNQRRASPHRASFRKAPLAFEVGRHAYTRPRLTLGIISFGTAEFPNRSAERLTDA